jgi:hypothetical protein
MSPQNFKGKRSIVSLKQDDYSAAPTENGLAQSHPRKQVDGTIRNSDWS